MNKKYIVMDVDTGCDDSMALMLAKSCPDIEILALTCVFGNNDVDTTTENTLKVAKMLGINAPVGKGAQKPLIDPPLQADGLGVAIHGKDGLGNVGGRLKKTEENLSDLTAVDLMAKVIKEAPEKVTVVATGPLTNIATFLVSYPELQDKIEQIALMGGAAYGGNLTFNVEANTGHDPEATAIVFMSGVKKVMFGLDAPMAVYITNRERQLLAENGGEVGVFLKDCLQAYADTYKALANYPGAVLHDSLPLAWLIDESCVQLKDAYVEIDLNGAVSRGCTVADFMGICQKPRNTKIAMRADREKIIKMHTDGVKAFANVKI